MLNWTPGAEHAPVHYAREQGWYRRAGIDLTIESGRGSVPTVARVGNNGAQFGIADLPTMLVGRGNGADLKAVMALYANSAQTFYWLKKSGIETPSDFRGRRIGNPPGDAARVMWDVFAQKAGVPPRSVGFVNVHPQGKIAALESGSVDIISDFYHAHDVKQRHFGEQLRYLRWSSIGLNFYGNALVVSGSYARTHPETVRKFVALTQVAYAVCVRQPQPCLGALQRVASGLEPGALMRQWQRMRELMDNGSGRTHTFGAFDPARLQDEYDAVSRHVRLRRPFKVRDAFTNEYLASGILLPP